jgi:hypothetical protein
MENNKQPQRRRPPTIAEMSQNCWNCAGYDFVTENSNKCGHAADLAGQRIADMLA